MIQPTNIAPLNRLLRWLDEPRHAGACWLGKHCVAVAWLGLGLAVLSPPHGFGVPVCWFQSSTGLPCPGCGMTRSLSCAVRGMFAESWHYHPMGLFVLLLFLLTAAQSLLPDRVHGALVRFVQARAFAFNSLYLAFVVAFLSYGVLRAFFHLGGTWLNNR